MAAKQTISAPVQKITIIPRTSRALGYTMQVEQDNHYLMTKTEIDAEVIVIVRAQHEKAAAILPENRKKLDELAGYLYQKETVTGEELR